MHILIGNGKYYDTSMGAFATQTNPLPINSTEISCLRLWYWFRQSKISPSLAKQICISAL